MVLNTGIPSHRQDDCLSFEYHSHIPARQMGEVGKRRAYSTPWKVMTSTHVSLVMTQSRGHTQLQGRLGKGVFSWVTGSPTSITSVSQKKERMDCVMTSHFCHTKETNQWVKPQAKVQTGTRTEIQALKYLESRFHRPWCFSNQKFLSQLRVPSSSHSHYTQQQSPVSYARCLFCMVHVHATSVLKYF